MALIILAHPNTTQSIVNKTIVDTVSQNLPNSEIRNIHQYYPNYNIDVKAEQVALLRHDFIVLQYPMYWYNMPAILKIWFDEVFTYNFAYGSQGDKLKGKKLLPSLTIGQPEQNFQQNGHFMMDDLLQPVKQSAQYAQMVYLEPILLYGVSTVSGLSQQTIADKAHQHSLNLIDRIRQGK